MIGQIDSFYVAAQIRLMRQVHKGAILILEADTDARLFGRFIDQKLCDLEIAFGKSNVVGALDLLEDEGFPGVLALVDADFDRLFGVTYNLDGLFLTEFHDLDLIIFCSPALEHYIAEHADGALFQKHFSSDINALREKVLRASLPFAYCRFISERKDLRLYFRDLRHDQFVTANDLSMGADPLIAELISRSMTPCTVDELKRFLTAELTGSHDIYQITNGHDVAAILGIALRQLLASRRPAQTWASEIESGLRLAFDREALSSTKLYRSLKNWEHDHRPYAIFPQ